MTADRFGCNESYFKTHIKGKSLKIVNSTPSHYVRVEDENQEEWGLFPGEYVVETGLGNAKPPKKSQTKKAKLLRKDAG